MPAQPDETQPARTREARGRRNPRRSRGAGRWGALQGGLGVCIIVASAAFGTIATMVTKSAPGFLLGLFVEAGTVVAALAVRPRAGRMIFPVPVLSYLVGALISGFVFNRTGMSKTALAIGAAQWVANGFFAMTLATVLAVAIITTRWYLWRRDRPSAREVGRDADWAAPLPATTRVAPPRRSYAAPDPATESGYPAAPRAPEGPRGQRAQPGGRTQPGERTQPGGRTQPGERTQPGGKAQPGAGAQPGRRAEEGRRTQGERRTQGAWDDADPRGGGRRPGPRPGTGPYNFSSGA